MKKSISKEQIVETALELMRNTNDLRGLNLREIARTLGCAHTNLYNYFPSYYDLLWETHAVIQEIFMERIAKELDKADTAALRLSCFFETVVNLYLDNKGWFRLLWHEYVGGSHPRRDIEATEAVNKKLNASLSDIWNELSGVYPEAGHVKRILHNIHCYIVGEVSNYILGRGLIEKETELRTYITREAICMFKLYMMGE